MKKRNLFASFVGINAYSQNKLNGCVKDVLDIDRFLREWTSQQKNSPVTYLPFYLLAPHEADHHLIRAWEEKNKQTLSYDRPDFKNITQRSFAHFTNADDGDICLFYYSGHGSQTEAPPEFWHTKPDRNNETLVCVDSRDKDNPEARDLIDKELAFLLYDVLEGKNVHALVITDCCHSGNITRAVSNTEGILYRHAPAAGTKTPLSSYLGYQSPKKFYSVKEGKASIAIARYVHLAAAMDAEKALETISGGLFTNKLVEVLRAGGTARSYRSLMQELTISVQNRAEKQHPVSFAREEDDLDLAFLGTDLIPYRPAWPVTYDFSKEKWILHAGTIDGIPATSAGMKTSVRISEAGVEAEITDVFSGYSFLDEQQTTSLNRDIENYQAVIGKLAVEKLPVGISEDLGKNAAMLQNLKEAYSENPPLFFDIDFENSVSRHEYMIYTIDQNYVLTKPDSLSIVFKRESSASQFIYRTDAVCKWRNTVEMKNQQSVFSEKDFIFSLEKIEGQKISAENIEQTSGEKIRIKPGEENLFRYINNHQPAFRLHISIHPDSSLNECYVGALYLDAQFGIGHQYIRKDANRLIKIPDNTLSLSTNIGGRDYQTLPLTLDKSFEKLGVSEITEYLKIFVSAKPVNLERFGQKKLEMDKQLTISINRNIDFENTSEEGGWTVFTFPFRIVRTEKEKKLESGAGTDFPQFLIETPRGLNAMVYTATGNDVEKKFRSATSRSADEQLLAASAMIMPPASIWGDALTDEFVFDTGNHSSGDNSISVLEFKPERDGETLQIPEGQAMLIRPKNIVSVTRSVDDELEDIIIPFGYDPEAELYFPLGFSDENGVIHIQKLPPPTPGTIQGEEALSRSLGGSIKLFFRKIFRRKKNINKLVLYRISADFQWTQLSDKPAEMKQHLSAMPDTKCLLLVHGLTGDSRHISESLKALTELTEEALFILTYDYENLATPLEKTADWLHKDLLAAGFGQTGMPSLEIIAHSQGGLVSRWLVEQGGGAAYVRKLILVASPSAGSPLAKLGTSVFGMLTHALNVTGPVKYVITGLSFLLKKLELDPGKTLKQTNPGSDFLQKLSLSVIPAGVEYYVISGDINLLKDGYNGDDYFLKKVMKALVKNVVYPGLTVALYRNEPNDMAVSIESMVSIPSFDKSARSVVVASNHLAYFREKKIQEELIGYIKA